MSQVSAVAESETPLTSRSEKNATSPTSARTTSLAPAPVPKLRSCVVCRNRKVRCDKQSPCSNCRRANISCVFPLTNHPPRWARRFERYANNAASNAPPRHDAEQGVDKAMDRLRTLENLVKELRSQLEQAHAAASLATDGSSEVKSPGSSTKDFDVERQRDPSPPTDSSSVHKHFGRLVLQDANRSRYVSSGFWSRVNDELDGLKVDTGDLAGDVSDSSEEEASPGRASSTREVERTLSERYAFMFRHNFSLSASDLCEFHPLPSQIPFLLEVFSENVNFIFGIVHIPTVTKIVRDMRGDGVKCLTPSDEALMFSIYYAAIISMEEDDIMNSFGSSKTDLAFKYRLGLEHALAKADFLNVPDIVLVQAFAIFLCLARRYDSPRFVWMMTGLVIRMAQYLGLQRDGTHFPHLTPFEIEMRRKVWWAVCMLDVRTSEDQGTDLTITNGSFDTKIPMNINHADIGPESKQMPTERYGVTDMSFARISAGITDVVRQMMTSGAGGGGADLEEQSCLLNEIYRKFEQEYVQYTAESGNILCWVAITVARLVMAKMTLVIFLPVLFSSPSEHMSDTIRTKLLVSAIEVAEYNHALNAEQACRQWRWLYQTHTHWHAIVYLMIEICRRPWSPIVERAWAALNSSWLIPAQNPIDRNLRIWIPLRKLMGKTRKHREAELSRLRADPQAATELEVEDRKIPLPSSSGPFPTGSSVDAFRERWQQLVAISEGPGDGIQAPGISDARLADPSMHTTYANQPTARVIPAYSQDNLGSDMTFEPTDLGTNKQQGGKTLDGTNIINPDLAFMTDASREFPLEQTVGALYNPSPAVPADWSDGRTMVPGSVHWLWADADPSVDVFANFDVDSINTHMDLDGGVDWYNWVESVKSLELDVWPSGSGRT